MRRALLLPILALLSAGCTGPADLGEPDDSSSYTQPLAAESYYTASFSLAGPSAVRISITVSSGGPLDVWLGSGSECGAWLSPDFAPTARVMGIANGSFMADLPKGAACLILDNAALAPGETSPTGPVVVDYRIETWRTG